MAHTPGPWRVSKSQTDAIVGPRCTESCDECDAETVLECSYGDLHDGHFICESVSSAADFNLIVRVPELLTFIAKVVKILDRADYVAEALEGQRLIAEATGEPQ